MSQEHLRQPPAHVAGQDCFTGREPTIDQFLALADAPAGSPLPVLVLHGEAGIGKTTLLRHLYALLGRRRPPIPCACAGLESASGPLAACREILLALRAELGRTYGIDFARFDLCLSVTLARDGVEPPPLVRASPMLNDTLSFACEIHRTLFPPAGEASPLDLTAVAERFVRSRDVQSPGFRGRLTRSGGTAEVLRLHAEAADDDEFLQCEMVRCFAADLKAHLPGRPARACRGALFLDALDALHAAECPGEERVPGGVDAWVRALAAACADAGVLLVATSHEPPNWEDAGVATLPCRLDGFSEGDSRLLLARCGVGPSPEEGGPSDLQRAILECCRSNELAEPPAYHPLFLALGAETALILRERGEQEPGPAALAGVQAAHLAGRFLESLPDAELAAWVSALALTPRFDEKCALALGRARDFRSAPAGWQRLSGCSFVQAQPGGFVRMHPLVRAALSRQVDADLAREVNRWSLAHWRERGEIALAWQHEWLLDPEDALSRWGATLEAALEEERYAEAQALFGWWGDTDLGEAGRQAVGDGPWAATHYGIACALWEVPAVPRAPALAAAIEHCGVALRVYTETRSPMDWARVQSTLGALYRALPAGDRVRNTRRAVECYEGALRVHTEAAHPLHWARTLCQLGNTYIMLPAADRGESLVRAIECYEAALRVLTEEGHPLDWAHTQHNIGRACWDLPSGSRDANLRRAIECGEASLRVYTEEEFPIDWAMAQNAVGNAYGELATGDRDANLRRAIECYEAALRVYTEEDFPEAWAGVQQNLGTTYADLQTGDHEENSRRAVECYQAALRVYTEEDYPVDWAETQSSLGTVYAESHTGDRAKNLKRAIACYQAALSVCSEEETPEEWAMAQTNLGSAYWKLPIGDRGRNLRKAIIFQEAALRVYTCEGFPEDWARTQSYLGLIYADLPTGDRAMNLRYAIECFEASLTVYTEEEYPDHHVRISQNLASARSELRRHLEEAKTPSN